jgi:hypothetical protein
MRIPLHSVSAIIIDVQEKLFPFMYNKEVLEKNLQILIQGLKILNIPIIISQQYTKGLGPTISSIAQILPSSSNIEKSAFSCCDEPAFLYELRKSQPEFVILAGIESHVCVLQTALDLLEKGYKPVIPADCTASRKESDYIVAIERLRTEGSIISSYESLLFELLRYSGSENFKAISKLIK